MLLYLTSFSEAIAQSQLKILLEVSAMIGILWLFLCFLWIIGLALLAELFFYEEEQQF
ncbi:hypothetical protein QUB80_13885 [Chlorogloeopsis sp. ULAP01]|nr:hypothetical protein [Chlorogloeopsis sp. ULAP01]